METVSPMSLSSHENNRHENTMDNLPLILPYQMLQVHKVLHMLQHLELQLLHYRYYPVLGLLLETALNSRNMVAKEMKLIGYHQTPNRIFHRSSSNP